jgi:hypothetical protein
VWCDLHFAVADSKKARARSARPPPRGRRTQHAHTRAHARTRVLCVVCCALGLRVAVRLVPWAGLTGAVVR